jgi:hypothetical protein
MSTGNTEFAAIVATRYLCLFDPTRFGREADLLDVGMGAKPCFDELAGDPMEPTPQLVCHMGCEQRKKEREGA